MKVAVILLGRIDSEYESINKKLFEGCDVYVHTDEVYTAACKVYKPYSTVITDSLYHNRITHKYLDKYSNTISKIRKTIPPTGHFSPNFTRITQWKRLDNLLETFNFSEYDYIIKWRLDIFKFTDVMNYNFTELVNKIVEQYDGLYRYITEGGFSKNNLYSMLDFTFLGSYDSINKANLYPNINKYIGKKEETFSFNKEIYDESDFTGELKCAKVQWLVSKDKPFNHVFTSETAMILNCLQQNLAIKNIFRPLL